MRLACRPTSRDESLVDGSLETLSPRTGREGSVGKCPMLASKPIPNPIRYDGSPSYRSSAPARCWRMPTAARHSRPARFGPTKTGRSMRVCGFLSRRPGSGSSRFIRSPYEETTFMSSPSMRRTAASVRTLGSSSRRCRRSQRTPRGLGTSVGRRTRSCDRALRCRPRAAVGGVRSCTPAAMGDRIHQGNALTWCPPDGRRFTYAHTLLGCVPPARPGDLSAMLWITWWSREDGCSSPTKSPRQRRRRTTW